MGTKRIEIGEYGQRLAQPVAKRRADLNLSRRALAAKLTADVFPVELVRECPACQGNPPQGFTCQACGRG